MSLTTNSLSNSTSNTTTPWPTTTPATTTVGYLGSDDGKTILALLVVILIVLLLIPLIVYLLVKKVCTEKNDKRKVHPEDDTENNKETQTDVLGLELQEFYHRRKPIDMSKYMGKKLIEVEEPPRWYQYNPKEWNDPWTSKYAGKETNYIGKVW